MHALRYAIRRLVRDRTVSIVAIGTLALGVAVLTASFAVVDAVLLQPIVAHQNRVVRFWKNDVSRDDFRAPLSYAEFKALRDRSKSFEGLAAVQYMDTTAIALSIDGRASAVKVAPVSPEFLPLVATRGPMQGRWFTADEDRESETIAAVVSARYWRTVAAAGRAFVGRRLRHHDGRSLVVVGIAPDALDYPIGADVWVPIGAYFRGVRNEGFKHFELVGRLVSGVSIERARAELDAIDRAVAPTLKDVRVMDVVAMPLIDSVLDQGRRALMFLLAGAGLVLLVAGVNVAALLLMRAARQRRDQAVRLALGASRLRLLRETATDSLVLGTMATVAGVALAYALLALVRWIEPSGLPRLDTARLDARVLAAAGGAVLLWMVSLGTAPAWAHRRLDPARVGDLSSRGQPGRLGLGAFTIAQIAVALVVAIGAGLLLRSFVHLQSIERGFEPANLAVIPVVVPQDRYKDARSRVDLFRDLLTRIDALPGVLATTTMHMGPGTGSGGLSGTYDFEGQTEAEAKQNPWASFDSITPSYFRTLGVSIREGRDFTDADSRDAAPVAIVSESMARRYWPGQRAVGKRLRFAEDSPWSTVVGVAGDMRYRELTQNWMAVYFPAAQFFFYQPQAIIVRSASSPMAILPSVRAAILAREPGTAIPTATTMDRMLARELSRQRTTFAVMLLFATMTMFLAVVGVYGVLSYDVSQRRHELAVRSALGASPARLFRRVVKRSLGLGTAGAALGFAIALAATRVLEPLLFEVSPLDQATFWTAATLLLASAAVAAIAPGARAARTQPAAVLRQE